MPAAPIDAICMFIPVHNARENRLPVHEYEDSNCHTRRVVSSSNGCFERGCTFGLRRSFQLCRTETRNQQAADGGGNHRWVRLTNAQSAHVHFPKHWKLRNGLRHAHDRLTSYFCSFFYVVGHGMPQEAIDRCFATTKKYAIVKLASLFRNLAPCAPALEPCFRQH